MLDVISVVWSSPELWAFVVLGFVAQLFDGALGMGFGAISSAVLAVLGVPREIASASVNGAKILTGTASGVSHLLLRNVDGRMLLVLAMAGMAGGGLGALLMTHLLARWVAVAISLYLLMAGVFIVWQALRVVRHRASTRLQTSVGFAGGLLEATSGVWGPLVTSNLVALGASPRYVIGTGNIAETFVAATVFTLVISHVGFERLSTIVVGLLVGALIAAPFAALAARRLAARPLTIAVGTLVIVTSVIRLLRDLGAV